MAMRLLQKTELEAILIKDYGCRKVLRLPKADMWENHEGKGFSVSYPEELNGNSYPDWIIDEIIQKGNLKFGAKRAVAEKVDIPSAS